MCSVIKVYKSLQELINFKFCICAVTTGDVRFAESAVTTLHQHGRPAGGVG